MVPSFTLPLSSPFSVFLSLFKFLYIYLLPFQSSSLPANIFLLFTIQETMKFTPKTPISLILQLFLFSIFLSMPQISTCSEDLRGSVSCLDCLSHRDLSGIKVVVKCSGVKELATGTTKEDGSFIVTHLPSSDNCLAKIVGGPTTLYVSPKDAFSKTVLLNHPDSEQGHYYTLSAPLKFYTSNQFMSSKTYDIPFPPEWGLPPTHYYTIPSGSPPVMPIIGIP